MLRPPHDRYDRLFVYYFDRSDLPPVDDPDLIGAWVEDGQAILFFHHPRQELAAALCKSHSCSLIYQADLAYQDWEAGVALAPFATRYLRIRPVWESAAESDQRQEIVLDPSVIFGSGLHASTRLCLETLEQLMLESGARIGSVRDLGTGTGLLALAAARLGASQVLGVDHNPLAVEVARANVARNGCSRQVAIERADLLAGLPDCGSDLVIANLYRGLLAHLLADPDFWHAQYYLLSGFLSSMEGDLLAALGGQRVRLLHRGVSGPWRLWLLRRETGGGTSQ